MVILLVLFALFDLLLLLGALMFWWLLMRAWRAERSASASVSPSPPPLPARVIALLGRDDVRRLNEWRQWFDPECTVILSGAGTTAGHPSGE